MVGRRFEVSTVGIDEALQGLSTDPFGSAFPTTVGLRIPAFINSPSTRYLFLLATRQVANKEVVRVRGIRQYLTIGASAAASVSIPTRPVEFEVVTPSFRFPDGNVSWHLVREPPQLVDLQRPNTDLPSFAFADADQSALLYQSYVQSAATGFYMLNLTAYMPPLGRLSTWEPIANLGNFHDIRFEWRGDHAWGALDEYVAGPCRVSFYASVLQTNPATRPLAVFVNPLPPGPPEELFINSMSTESFSVSYWRVAGSLIFEDC